MTEIPAALQSALSGHYDLQRVLGHGGMATVYLARDVRHRRDVAVKVLRSEVAAALGTDRFLREIRIAANLTHPHILPLYDSGRAGGFADGRTVDAKERQTAQPPDRPTAEFLYYVMPYIEGESLRTRLVREGSLKVTDALALAEEVADALGYAHRQGIIHRDIKPENILLGSNHAVVADFGIAKALSSAGGKNLTRTGFPIGTVGYMSPEQAAGTTDLDATSDVFSLACVCYEMLMGEVPGKWVGDDDVRQGRFLEAPLRHRPKLNALPREIEPALVHAMAMRPKDRFRTPVAFVAALAGKSVAVIERADPASSTASGDSAEAFSVGGVERIAAEVGISPEHVREAIAVVETVDPPAKPTMFAGTRQPLVFERTVSGELSEDDVPLIVERIRQGVGSRGLVSTLGRSIEWTSMANAPGGRLLDPTMGPSEMRDVSVTITPRDGHTKIRVEERMGRTRLMSLAMGTAALVPAAVLAGTFSASTIGSWAGLGVVGAAVTVGIGGSLAFVARLARKRAVQARELADVLAEDVARSARAKLR